MRHPDDTLLLEYSAGSLSEAEDLLLATHLSLCRECRDRSAALDALGGALLGLAAPQAQPDDRDTLSVLLSRLNAPPPSLSPPPPTLPPKLAGLSLPEPLRSALARSGVQGWSMVIPGMVRQIVLPIAWAGAPVRLTCVRGGFHVPLHTHRGRELNLVLAGGFHDDGGGYGPGDVAENDETVVHALAIDPGEDCIILAVNEAPLVPVGLSARIAGWVTGF